MFHKSTLFRIVPVFVLVLTPVLTYRLGRWENALTGAASASFEYAPAVWRILAANLFIVVWWLFMAWLVAFRSERERFLAIIYIAVGLALTFIPLLVFLVNMDSPLLRWLMEPPFRNYRNALIEDGLTSRTTLSSLFITLVGLLGLMSKRQSK